MKPRFTVAVIHYEGSVLHADYVRCVRSVYAQSFSDYELLVYHDGPMQTQDTRTFAITCTPERANNWGHSLRDLAIQEAQGEYILFLNADNLLYPNALEEISKVIDRPPLWDGDEPNAVIYPILMKGCTNCWNGSQHVMVRDKRAADVVSCVLTGFPPIPNSIDAMQFVGRVDLWREMGGWKDKRENSDGYLFQEFAERWKYRTVDKVLGEHF